ncbi:MAG: class B sortase [Clostridia bacterium]|nr:class B sortase [Clostridia bacterium]NCD02840.1 class B sortase [Clostridia bacterium]
MNKKKYITIMVILSLVLLVSIGFIVKNYLDSTKQQELYNDLIEVVETEPEEDEEPLVYDEDESFLLDYQELYLQNNDMVGWIKVEDTQINYPVVQSKEEPNFYLKHKFDKTYSVYGCPYVQENCDTEKPSDNLIIYGHHMNDGSMFAGLMKYGDKGFYENHKTITFDSLTQHREYEVVAAFRTVAYSNEGFKYHQFVDAENEKEYTDYIEQCKELSIYDTGISAAYGDKLITLSTCEYSRNNGRFVVVAKLKTE